MPNTSIPTKDRLIFALDVPTADRARDLVEQLDDAVSFYKIGLQLFMAGGYFDLLDWLKARDKKVFVDLKFFDVPKTVGLAVERLNDKGASFATVHGNDAMLEEAVKAASNPELKILAVTVLTSLDKNDMQDLGFDCDIEQLVLSRARRACEIGCGGVVASGLEAAGIRGVVNDDFNIVTPGIRPDAKDANRNADDQKRVVTVESAFRDGADYIVVGRPIRDAGDPYAAAQSIQASIRSVVDAA